MFRCRAFSCQNTGKCDIENVYKSRYSANFAQNAFTQLELRTKENFFPFFLSCAHRWRPSTIMPTGNILRNIALTNQEGHTTTAADVQNERKRHKMYMLLYVLYISLTVFKEEEESDGTERGRLERKILLVLIKRCVSSNETFYLPYKNLPNYSTQFADTLNRFFE